MLFESHTCSLAVSVHKRFGLCFFFWYARSGRRVSVECVQLFCKYTWRRECINFYDSILHLRFFPFAASARQPKGEERGKPNQPLSHTRIHTERIKTLSLDNFVCASDYIRTAYECCVCNESPAATTAATEKKVSSRSLLRSLSLSFAHIYRLCLPLALQTRQ